MNGYTVAKIRPRFAITFIRRHHYSGGCHNGPLAWGLVSPDGKLHGVCAFATPSSESVRSSVFGPAYNQSVTELHRLAVLDEARNAGVTTSWFVSQALRHLKRFRPAIKAVISFSDYSEGHVGTIYQATNFMFCGETLQKRRFFRDKRGRLRHPRQNGSNISLKEAQLRGWTIEYRERKNRYLIFIGSKKEKRWARKNCLLEFFPYPKSGITGT